MGDVNQEQLLPWNPTPSCRGRGAGSAASDHGQQPLQNLWQEVITPQPIPPARHSLAGDQRRSVALRSQGTGNYFWSGGKHTTLSCLQGNKTGKVKHNLQRESALQPQEQQPTAARPQLRAVKGQAGRVSCCRSWRIMDPLPAGSPIPLQVAPEHSPTCDLKRAPPAPKESPFLIFLHRPAGFGTV